MAIIYSTEIKYRYITLLLVLSNSIRQ